MGRPDVPPFDSSPRNLGNPVVFDAQNQRSKSSAAESARRYSLFKGGLLAVGVVFGIGVVSSFLTRNTDAGVSIANVGEQIGRVQNVFESSHFETKDEAKPVRIKIHVHGDDEIQVRNDSVLGDKAILGITKPGLVVTGIEGTGIFYLNDEHRTTEDGEKKGLWYRIDEVPIFEKVGNEYFPKLDGEGKPVVAKDVYIATHFGDVIKNDSLIDIPNNR